MSMRVESALHAASLGDLGREFSARIGSVLKTLAAIVAAWIFGVALIAFGVLWIQHDREFRTFDVVCIVVGFAAIPTMTDRLRRRLRWNFGARAHAAAAIAMLGAALAFDMRRSEDAPAPYPVQGRADFAARGARVIPADFAAAPETRVHPTFSAGSSRARDPRLGFVAAIDGPLSRFGLAAKLAGPHTIVFSGAALADPAKQALLVRLTQTPRLRLGLAVVRFDPRDPPVSLATQTPASAPASPS